MKFLFNKKFLLIIGLLVAAFVSYRLLMPVKKVDFCADVKPILNKKCIACHGGVKAKAGFSVLFREDALAKTVRATQYGVELSSPNIPKLVSTPGFTPVADKNRHYE